MEKVKVKKLLVKNEDTRLLGLDSQLHRLVTLVNPTALFASVSSFVKWGG